MTLGPDTQATPRQPATGTGWVLSGRYRVIDRIGAGGMAEVFRAHDELLARDVAVKVFRAQPVTPDTASGVERQEIELRALAHLNHPNLITLFDGSITGGPAFLVMELINGPTLAARIADAPLPEPEAAEVGIQIADALAYVHEHHMVHRDVKPANILLGTDRTSGDSTVRARLSDFGIVRLLGSERLTSMDLAVGTASYLAPEQARGTDVGPVADVYSLGLVLIEALTGLRSFDGPPMEAMLARLTRDPEVPRYLPPPWPALLTAMTASDPAARPAAARVAQTLRDARTGSLPIAIGAAGETAALPAADPRVQEPPPTVAEPRQPTHGPPSRRRTAWLLAAAGVVAALATAGVLILRPTSQAGAPAERQPATSSPTHASSPGTHGGPVVPVNGPTASPTVTRTHSTPHTSAAPSSHAAPSTSAAASTSAALSGSAAPGTSVAASTNGASGPPSSGPPASSAAALPGSPSPSTGG